MPSRVVAIAHPRSDNTANATPSNPNAVVRKGVDTPPNKTRYDIRRLNRLLNVRRYATYFAGKNRAVSARATQFHKGGNGRFRRTVRDSRALDVRAIRRV